MTIHMYVDCHGEYACPIYEDELAIREADQNKDDHPVYGEIHLVEINGRR